MPEIKSIQAVCFPFAGGTEYSYDQLKSTALFDWKVARLPGRGQRISERLITDIHKLVEDFWKNPGFESSKPYFIYGHSMGTLLAYEVALEAKRRKLPSPLFLMVSGRKAPCFSSKSIFPKHKLEKEAFWREVKKYGGLPEKILNEPELLDYFEPLLRADFKVGYHYVYDDQETLDIPVVAVAGKEENISEEELNAWQEVTSDSFKSVRLPGDHFFIFENAKKITCLMQEAIRANPSLEMV